MEFQKNQYPQYNLEQYFLTQNKYIIQTKHLCNKNNDAQQKMKEFSEMLEIFGKGHVHVPNARTSH